MTSQFKSLSQTNTLTLLEEIYSFHSDTPSFAFAIEWRSRFTWITESCRSMQRVSHGLLTLRPKLESSTKFLLGDVKIKKTTLDIIAMALCADLFVYNKDSSRIFGFVLNLKGCSSHCWHVHRVTFASSAYEIVKDRSSSTLVSGVNKIS
jgi:hypothetical protein